MIIYSINKISCKFMRNLYTNSEDIYKKLDNLTKKCPSILTKNYYTEKETNKTMKYYTINYKKNQKKKTNKYNNVIW